MKKLILLVFSVLVISLFAYVPVTRAADPFFSFSAATREVSIQPRKSEPHDIYVSSFMGRTYSKLEQGNRTIKDIEGAVNMIAPGSGTFKTWNDRLTGYYGIMFGKKLRKKVDLNISYSYAKGALDNHTKGVINTLAAPYSAVAGQILAADFRQEYTTKTISAGPKYIFNTGKQYELSFTPKLAYIFFRSDTDYSLSTPGIDSRTSVSFTARKLYAVGALEYDRFWNLSRGRRINLGFYIEYIPKCVMKNDAHGYEINNGVSVYKAIPGEIDLTSKRPHFGAILNYYF